MTIDKIKTNITKDKGKKVKIKINGSRNKKEEYNGIIEEVYNCIFTVKDEKKKLKSFSYSDILTKTVEIFVQK